MAIFLDHLLVPSHDKVAAAKFLAELLGIGIYTSRRNPSPACGRGKEGEGICRDNDKLCWKIVIFDVYICMV